LQIGIETRNSLATEKKWQIHKREEELMGKVKIFYKNSCPLCGSALKLKESLAREKVEVEYFNVETAEGLAEATFYGVYSLPTIIVEDRMENEIRNWRGSVPSLSEVLDAVKNP
jgi:glutaredoxin